MAEKIDALTCWRHSLAEREGWLFLPAFLMFRHGIAVTRSKHKITAGLLIANQAADSDCLLQVTDNCEVYMVVVPISRIGSRSIQ